MNFKAILCAALALCAVPATAAERRPLVQISGQVQQIPAGDTLVGVRAKKTAITNYYIRTDGSDANCDGLTDAAYSSGVTACAFSTWQKGTDIATSIDNGGYDVYIRAGAETGVRTWNTSAINIIGPLVGNGSLHYTGNGANTVLVGATDLFYINGPLHVWIGNLKIKSLGGYGTINVGAGANVGLEAVGPIFDTASYAHIFVHENLGYFTALNSTYSIVGGAQHHYSINNNGSAADEGNTVTLTGTPAFSSWINLANSAYLQSTNNTYVGSATGMRYFIDTGSVANTLGNGVNYFPGNAAGISTNGGLYAATNTTGFNSVNIGSFTLFGGNKQQMYEGGVNNITFCIANAAACTDYFALRLNASNQPIIAAASPHIGLGSGGAGAVAEYVYADGFGFHVLTGPVYLSKVVAAGLGTCNAGSEGALIGVTDSGTATFNATVTGGGSNHVMAYCNGTNWTVH